MRFLFVVLLAMLPHFAYAAGGGDDGGSDDGGSGSDDDSTEAGDVSPPEQTKTTLECIAGEVWDEKTAACVKVQGNLLDNDQRYKAVRELAYAGRPADAMAVLATMTEGRTARVMTYQGFLLRKTGHVEAGIAAYEEAIRIDAGNILARSYYGQLLVEMNEMELAQLQLAAIRMHGGGGTWAERSLATAIETGVTYTY